MAYLTVVHELGDRPIAVADFILFVPPWAEPDHLRVLRYYDPYADLAINERMLDDFEHDIRNGEASYVVTQRPPEGGAHRPVDEDKAALVLPFIERARMEHCYIVIQGD
jgi:hypothetical protein